MRTRRPWVVLAIGALAGARLWASEATITSDELEIQNNGDTTIFRGHVILQQSPYEVRADRMVRRKIDSVVNADGHVVGTWLSAKGEKLRIEGEMARFEPSQNTVEVWGGQQVLVNVRGDKGQATFHGDRGWAYTLTPGKAKLVGRVTGHVIPDSTS